MNPSVAAVLQVLVQAKGISQVNSQLAGMNSQLAATSTKSGAMGAAVKKGMMVGAAAIGAAGVALFKLGESFDDAYDTIRVGTGATGKKLEGLKGDFKDVVRAVPASFGDASAAIADLNTRLGLTGKPLQTSAKQFLELSRITKTDVKANIKDVTRAFGDWEVKTRDQGGQLDKFFRAAQSSGASVGDLAKQVVQFGAPLRQVGFSLDEATAMFANFEKAGVNTQTMMPGIKMAMKTFFEQGIDPKKGLQAAFKGIQDGSIDASGAIKIFGVRAGGDMIEAVKQGRFNLDKMTSSLVNGSDTIMKAGKDTQDFGEKWQMIKNRVLVGLEPLAMAVFNGMGKAMDILPPIVSRIYEALRTLLTPFTLLTGAITGNKTAMVALGAASGVLLAAWAGFAIVAGVTTAIRATVGAFWALNAAMAANPIGLVVIAIAALVAAFVVAYRESETFRKIVTGAWEAIKKVAGAVFPAIGAVVTTVWNAISTVTSTVWNAIKSVLQGVWGSIRFVVTTSSAAVVSVIRGAWGIVQSVTSTIWNAIKSLLGTVWGAIKTAAGLAWTGVSTAILTPIRFARDTLSEVVTGIANRLGAGWTLIKAAASAAWGVVRDNILSPLRSARDTVSEIIAGLASRVAAGWDKILGGVKTFAGNIKDKIVGAFKGAANAVLGIANDIIGVINKIPGVSIGKIKGFAEGGEYSAKAQAFARGGAYGATGGVIDRPMALFGEESPRWPEIVVPSNPAYRKRAQALVGQAASMVGVPGFAEGGVVDAFKGAIGRTGASAKPSLALFMAGIVESGLRNLGYGDRDSRGALQIRDSTARGMGINNMDPFASAMAFLTRGFWGKGSAIQIAARNPGMSAGNVAQSTQGSAFPYRYDQVRDQALAAMSGGGGGKSGGGGILGAIGGALSSVGGVLGDLLSKGAGFLLDKLPGVGDLPDFLKGTGKYVLDKAGDWIKGKVSDIIGSHGGGDGGGGGGGNVTGLVPAVKAALEFARSRGWGGSVSSGFRSFAEQTALYQKYLNGTGNLAARPGTSNHEGGQAVDVTDTEAFAKAMRLMGDSGLKRLVPGEPWHFSVTGRKMGGIYGGGVLGSYAGGTDYVPQTGPYMLHRGESVAPAAQSADGQGRGNVIVQGDLVVRNEQDARVTAERLAFRLRYSA